LISPEDWIPFNKWTGWVLGLDVIVPSVENSADVPQCQQDMKTGMCNWRSGKA